MTTPALLDELVADEGLRLRAYQDTRGRWTIGVGHTGPEVRAGLVWSRARCLDVLRADVARTEAALDRALSWWRRLSPVRQDVLADMAFNLGVEGLLAFHRTLAAAEAGDYAEAARRMLQSEPWRSQVGRRAERLAEAMATGARSPRKGASS